MATSATHCYKTGKVLCLIINEKIFDVAKENEIFQFRQGADEDEISLRESLDPLNVEIRLNSNLTSKEIIQLVQDTSHELNSEPCPYSGFMMFAMSHGGQANNQDFLLGKDKRPVFASEIIAPFHNANCSGLNGKPKCFLFNCCRGDMSNMDIKEGALPDDELLRNDPFDEVVIDDVEVRTEIRFKKADYIIVQSTVGGFTSTRSPSTGSTFIQAISESFKTNVRDTKVSFSDVIKDVKIRLGDQNAGNVAGMQIPEITDTLTYEFCLELKGNYPIHLANIMKLPTIKISEIKCIVTYI